MLFMERIKPLTRWEKNELVGRIGKLLSLARNFEVSMSKTKQVVKENLDFGEAWNILLSAPIQLDMKPGQTAILDREGWNGADQYVRILLPSAPHPNDSKDANPQNPYFRMADNNADADGTLAAFAVIKTTRNQVFPWTPSQGDLFGRDYRISILG